MQDTRAANAIAAAAHRKRAAARFDVNNTVMAEIACQDARWGVDRTLWPSLWLLLMAEELGEVALWTGSPPARTDADIALVREEAIQLAAVTHQFIAAILTNRVPFTHEQATDRRDLGVLFSDVMLRVGDLARAILEGKNDALIENIELIERAVWEIKVGVNNQYLHDRAAASDGTDERVTEAKEDADALQP